MANETASVYTSAFWSSDCCGAPFWRVIFGDRPDRYVCRGCERECAPIRGEGAEQPEPFATEGEADDWRDDEEAAAFIAALRWTRGTT